MSAISAFVVARTAATGNILSTMSSRKRSLREANIASPQEVQEDSLIHNLRNSFYFANLYQWICIFGKVVKIDDNLDIEVRPYGLQIPAMPPRLCEC